jgi:hypothetical protein
LSSEGVAMKPIISLDERTPIDWFKLVVGMEREAYKLDQADRRYIRLMISMMEMGVEPTLGHRKQIIEIKRKLDDLD